MESDRNKVQLLIILALFLVGVIYLNESQQKVTPTHYSISISETYPHDDQAFTQGLEYHDGYLYESTGLYGYSSLRKTELATGVVSERVDLSDIYFGEGMTIMDDRIYLLTWKENTCFVYSLDNLTTLQSFSYSGEGWGLTNDGDHLILSNGSSTLSFMNPETFKVVKTIEVTYDEEPVPYLNELEYVNGVVYANIWKLDQIIMINPNDGSTVGWIDLEGIENHLDSTDNIDVLNGIAYNPDSGRLLVTGKLWPNIFEIELVPK